MNNTAIKSSATAFSVEKINSEVKNIMNKYNITNTVQFPDISRFDPVARAICLRPGQVCHIVRPSKTSIETNYYRICV